MFTDKTAADSVGRKFTRDMNTGEEVIVYTKPLRGRKGFSIPTPVGNNSHDWAIAFR